jgi:hypothetical protein
MTKQNESNDKSVLNRRNILLAGTTLAVASAVVSGSSFQAAQAQQPAAQQPAQKPNVVFILADNVGYGDLGPYGGGELRGAPTPRTDQLAREGLRLTQFLVEPGCTPSRAALLTGRYSIREGLSLVLIPGSPNTLSARSVTMGELFKSEGYATSDLRRRVPRDVADGRWSGPRGLTAGDSRTADPETLGNPILTIETVA